jgi:hypothetical protein
VKDNVGEKERNYPAAVRFRVGTFARTEAVEPGDRRRAGDSEQRVFLSRQERSEERHGPHNPGTFQELPRGQPVESGKEDALNRGVKRRR